MGQLADLDGDHGTFMSRITNRSKKDSLIGLVRSRPQRGQAEYLNERLKGITLTLQDDVENNEITATEHDGTVWVIENVFWVHDHGNYKAHPYEVHWFKRSNMDVKVVWRLPSYDVEFRGGHRGTLNRLYIDAMMHADEFVESAEGQTRDGQERCGVLGAHE